jgi:hypothetical protein
MIYAYGQVLGNDHWMHLPGLASFRFSVGGEEAASALVTSDEPDDLVVEAFHRRVLPMAVQVRGREVLHASAVRTLGGVVSFCGVSQSGKSTIAFGLSQRGYSVWADDMVAFEFLDRQAMAVSLPFIARLRIPTAQLFDVHRKAPRLESSPPGETAPLAMVCVLRKDPEATPAVSIKRLSAADAFATVLDHACCFVPQGEDRKRLMVRHYLDLVAVTPIFEICTKPGLTNLPAILDAIEELLNAPPES